MRFNRVLAALAAGLVTAVVASAAFAQRDFSKVEITVEKVADGIHMLTGAGGNIGVVSGEDGVFVIDDQFAPLTDRIVAAIRTISDGPIRYVFNTHWHGDHTGGNENMGKAGAVIVAHDNVRARMSADSFSEFFNRETKAAPAIALPVVTFNDTITFHINGHDVYAFHVENAHTDGDTIIHFRDADVLHMGDTFFSGRYPFIDVESGGNIKGMIAAVNTVLDLIGDDTKIIPGHGPLSDKAGLTDYRDMLVSVRDAVASHVAAGKTMDETVAAKPTAALDEKYGGGFINGDAITKFTYMSLKTAN